MTEPETLFQGDGSAERPSRWIVMNDMDVRMFLATGVVPHVGEVRPFAPEINPPEQGWRLIDVSELGRPIPVRDVRRACLVHIRDVCEDGDYLVDPVPASLIDAIAFPTEQVGADWIARSSSFEGLPSDLPRTEAMGHLKFTEAATEDKFVSSGGVAALPSEADRVAGVFATLLSAGEVGPTAMRSLVAVDLPDRGLVLNLVRDSVSVDPSALDLCFEILSDPQWHGGFDPIELLEAIRSRLGAVIEAERVEGWADFVGEVLRNLRDVGKDTLQDAGDILLRALQLVLRTAPLTVREVDKQIAARRDFVGSRVGQLSRLFAAWYEGFGALAGVVKIRSEIYSIGSRSVAGSSHYPLNFTIGRRDDEAGFVQTTVLLESGREVISHVVRPGPEFMAAYYATEAVCKEKGWRLEYARDSGEMRLRVGDRLINAHLVSDEEICWMSILPVGDRPRARSWPRGFVESVLEAAATCRCVISSSNGFPNFEFKSYQLLGTMDRAEVGFHIEAISDAMDKIYELSRRVIK